MSKLKNRFPSLNLSARTVQRIVQQYKDQAESEDESREGIDLGRKRDQTGGQGIKLTPELAAKLVEINDKYWGKLSCKRLAGKLTAEGFSCSKDTVRH